MNYKFGEAHRALLRNARIISRQHEHEVAAWPGVVQHRIDNTLRCLPGYIPFIGRHYFDDRIQGRKILAYALSQNVSPDSDSAIE